MDRPVYAAMESVAASGGYYVAAGCRKIYAFEGTITGSIGVILQLGNFQELIKKIGISFNVIKSGQYKDIGSPYREMTEAEKSMLESNIKELYEQFVGDIRNSRKIDNQTLAEYTDGRIITGKTAVKLGFVDKNGTYMDAFNDLKKELKIGGLKLYEHKEKKKFFEKIMEKLPFNIENLFLNEGFYYLHQF
jgi:protease-4